jgi:hypothetical protein
MIDVLNDDGVLLISDFEEPYELEKRYIIWDSYDIQQIFKTAFGISPSIEIKKASTFPDEYQFYSCLVRKNGYNKQLFNIFIKSYDDFLLKKKEKFIKKRECLREEIESRITAVMGNSRLNIKDISKEKLNDIKSTIGEVYGIKAKKIQQFNRQIEYLDTKIAEFSKHDR